MPRAGRRGSACAPARAGSAAWETSSALRAFWIDRPAGATAPARRSPLCCRLGGPAGALRREKPRNACPPTLAVNSRELRRGHAVAARAIMRAAKAGRFPDRPQAASQARTVAHALPRRSRAGRPPATRSRTRCPLASGADDLPEAGHAEPSHGRSKRTERRQRGLPGAARGGGSRVHGPARFSSRKPSGRSAVLGRA